MEDDLDEAIGQNPGSQNAPLVLPRKGASHESVSGLIVDETL